jgi:diguanylate cyclase (GGDEF)-like protein
LPTAVPRRRLPLALLASDPEWSSRPLETILGPGGYDIVRGHTRRETLDQARRRHPDIILLDVHLLDGDGFELCRALHEDPHVGLSTPIMMLAVGPATKQQRLAALRAGAWEVLNLPVDAEELLLKLGAYVRSSVEANRAQEQGLVDPATGLYNETGLARRAREIGSEAFRHHTALACLVFGADLSLQGLEEETRVSDHVAHVFQSAGRVSDAIGKLGRTEFAIIAPDTNAAAAVRLAKRLMSAVDQTARGQLEGRVPLRVGYEALENVHATPVTAGGLLARATLALERACAERNGERIRRYE